MDPQPDAMTIALPPVPVAHAVRSRVAGALTADAAVAQLWVDERGDRIAFWALATGLDHTRELAIYAALADIRTQYPDTEIAFRLLDTTMFAPDDLFPEITIAVLQRHVPAAAMRFDLR